MIRLKPGTGVNLDNVHPRIYLAIGFAGPIWAQYGSPDLWLTAANEAGHGTGARGFHRLPDGTCRAVDLRTWTIPAPADRRRARDELAVVLGPLYDVLFEDEVRDPTTGKVLRGEHIHLQFDEDRPGTATA